jgi:hypothetical protein
VIGFQDYSIDRGGIINHVPKLLLKAINKTIAYHRFSNGFINVSGAMGTRTASSVARGFVFAAKGMRIIHCKNNEEAIMAVASAGNGTCLGTFYCFAAAKDELKEVLNIKRLCERLGVALVAIRM